jgi:polar amino acid transport system substrate-binding protein
LTAAAGRGADLVRKLLAFSRQEHLALHPIDLGAVVTDLMATLRRVLPESIEVRIENHGGTPLVLADRGTVEQILLNLTTNARDAMPDGGALTFTVRLGEETTDPRPARRWDHAPSDQTVQIVVSDTGCGMDQSILDRIFDPFFTTKGIGKGSGLGMAMVYGLMKQHGGFVDVYSAPEGGTSVYLHFPPAQVPEESETEPRPAGPPAGGHETLLLVEDEEPVRRVAAQILERMGYQVLTAVDGVDALAVYAAHQEDIALVVSDMVMPRMGGDGLLRELRRLGHGVPFLLASGYSSAAVADRVMVDAAVSYIEKPWTISELAQRVRQSLDARPLAVH